MTTRRQFLVGCSAAIAAYSGRSLVHAGILPTGLPHAPSTAPENGDILVVLFLRGGMDALHVLGPADDPDYIAARPANLRVTDKGDNAGLSLGTPPAGGEQHDFRLHKNAAPLKELFDAKHLAFVHACGLTHGTRSHFEAMDLVERGGADASAQRLTSGWLTRHLACLSPGSTLLPAFAADDGMPASLLGAPNAAAGRDLARFGIWGGAAQLDMLASLYPPGSPLHTAAQSTISTLKAVSDRLPRKSSGELESYKPQHGADYPDNPLANSLRTVARLVKTDLGLRVATVDFGGWDTHQGQTYFLPTKLTELSRALHAFYTDLTDHHHRLTVVVHSEFGRRLKSNKSDGTDHGHGSAMMLLGGNVDGGKIHGRWPGLATEQLDSRADLAVTTDYRNVLAEIILKRHQNAKLAEVFPGLAKFEPLNLIRGEAPTPIL